MFKNVWCKSFAILAAPVIFCASFGQALGENDSARLPSAQPVSYSSYADIDARLRALETNYSAANYAAEETGGWKKVDTISKPSGKVYGRMYFDNVAYDDPAFWNRLNETGFRTVRIGMKGDIFENVAYKMEVEFEGTEVDYKDVFMQFNRIPALGHIRVGHFKEPIGLEENTSSRFITFMERSLANHAFVPGRNVGFMSYNYLRGNERISWFLGTFRGDYDDSPSGSGFERQDGGDWVFSGRLAACPYYDECSGGRYLIHVGGGYSYRTTRAHDYFDFKAKPEVGTGSPYLRATTAVGDNTLNMVGIETAVVWSAFSFQAEYFGIETGDGADFSGGYCTASYFLTGEVRNYSMSKKAFDRVKPIENAFLLRSDGTCLVGRGAWEVAGRYSWVDLNAGLGPAAGYQNDLTFGVNWYLNPYTRIMFNYCYEDIRLNAGAGGAVGHANDFGVRFQVDW